MFSCLSSIVRPQLASQSCKMGVMPVLGQTFTPVREATVFHKWNKTSKVVAKKHAKSKLKKRLNFASTPFEGLTTMNLAVFARLARPEIISSETLKYVKEAPQVELSHTRYQMRLAASAAKTPY